MSQIIPPTPVDQPQTSFEWVDWYEKLRKVINTTEFFHNGLQGLQGGSSAERYHLTLAQYNSVLAIPETLDDLTDVTITAPATGAVLTYSGTEWIDSTAVSVDSVTATGNITITGTGILGNLIGAGGTITQATDKSTDVTLNKRSGSIVMQNTAMAAGATISFIVNNTTIIARDCVLVNIVSNATAGAYDIDCDAVAANAFRIAITNKSSGSLSEALVLNFIAIRAQDS